MHRDSERARYGETKGGSLIGKFLPIGGRSGSATAAQDSTAQGLKAWRRKERRLRLRQVRYRGIRLAEIQSVGKIVHLATAVALSERADPPAPLNQLQNRSVIKEQRTDSSISGIPSAES